MRIRRIRLAQVFPKTFFLTFLALSPLLAAQTDTEKNSTDSADLLANLPKSCHLTGEFSQAKQLPGFNAPILAHGDFFYACERGLIWRTTAPIAEAFIYPKKKSAAKVSTEDTFATLDGRAQKHLGKLLNNLIGGNREYLERNFKITDLNDTISLEPRKRRMKKFIQSIYIIHRDGGAQITMFQGNRETLVLDIVNAEEHPSLSQSDCTQGHKFSPSSCRYLFE